ncbi:biotin-dependent carboxyltransferase family protein [Selenomonadales bacterium OttesenSCG-928-I06]|nr:biotin-dependent carboxyltransferase family protein [Selenomonadales bacterium OttesenSCG-928-I06]
MIKVINPGFFTTIQDEGRYGYQAFGLPVSGAMDGYAYRVANILVGNTAGAAVIEMISSGGTFEFVKDAYISICGADMGATLNGEKVAPWTSFYVDAGSILEFGYSQRGTYTYLAAYGGIDVPLILGSRSTYTRGGIGGHHGRALQIDDTLEIGEHTNLPMSTIILSKKFIKQYQNKITLRVLLGPQDDYFSKEGKEIFFSSEYTIGDDISRMSSNLEGKLVKHSAKPDIVSDASCMGAIQIPGSGEPIIMMADRQTTGGYAKIGAVITADLWKLAQAKPGDPVLFKMCTEELAEEELRTLYASYAEVEEFAAASRQALYRKYSIKVGGQQYNLDLMEVQ